MSMLARLPHFEEAMCRNLASTCRTFPLGTAVNTTPHSQQAMNKTFLSGVRKGC